MNHACCQVEDAKALMKLYEREAEAQCKSAWQIIEADANVEDEILCNMWAEDELAQAVRAVRRLEQKEIEFEPTVKASKLEKAHPEKSMLGVATNGTVEGATNGTVEGDERWKATNGDLLPNSQSPDP